VTNEQDTEAYVSDTVVDTASTPITAPVAGLAKRMLGRLSPKDSGKVTVAAFNSSL
jgi:hypothetical protein